MNPSPLLYAAFLKLNEVMKGTLDGTKIESLKNIINTFAIVSAIASMTAGVVPGIAGVIAVLTQTGLVWATYIKINNILGISMTEHTAKFLGSAIITNLVTNASSMLLAYAAATVISFIPFVGQAGAMAINGAIGYIIIYVAATLYLLLISKLIQPDGTLKVAEDDDTKHIIKQIIQENNLNDMIKEGRNSYKKAKADGSIDQAMKHPTCPNCGSDVNPGQKFCSNCGTALK